MGAVKQRASVTRWDGSGSGGAGSRTVLLHGTNVNTDENLFLKWNRVLLLILGRNTGVALVNTKTFTCTHS